MRFIAATVAALLLGAAGACHMENPDAKPEARAEVARVTTQPASTQEASPATVSERLLEDSSRRVLRMSNGFTLILQRNSTAPVAACRIYVKAGALTEQEFMGQGISHVLEHLVAGASSGKRKEEENTLLLQQIGNDSNAYTDEDQTCYFITTTAEKMPVAMDLLIDFTSNADFTREQFDREFQVVQREIEMGEAEAERTFYKHSQSTRYIVSPAKYPIIGFKQAFQKITYEDCKRYYARMYVPDNMIISIAGDIDLDKTEKLIVGQLAGIRRKGLPSIALPPEPMVPVPRRSVAHADVKLARVEWAFPTTSLYSPEMYPMDVLAGALGGSESSILVRKLRDELNLVADIGCGNYTPHYVEGQLSITAMLEAKDIPAAQTALFKVLEDVVKNGVPEDAVARAKAQVSASLVYGNQTAEQQAIRNAQDYLATGNIDFSEAYVKRIQAVSSPEVLTAARKYIQTERLLTTTLLPLDAKDPFAGAGTTQAAAGEVVVKKTILKNGVTLLISRNPAAPLASFNLYILGGLLAENEATSGSGATLMELLPRGTATRSHEQITNFLDGTGTTLSTTSGSNSFYLSMQCLKENASDAFGLFADVALHPAFAPEELDKVRKPLLAAVDQATEDWSDEAYKSLKEAYYVESPYKRLPVGRADVIAKLTAAQVRGHYLQYFLDPSKMVLSISGDIDVDAAAKWAEPFGEMQGNAPTLNLTSRTAAGKVMQRHTDKQSATIMMAFPPGMVITSPDRHALILLQTYLGGYSSPFGSALHESLRGQGLVYTVQAQAITGPAGGMFLITALGEPQNVDKILQMIRRIIADTKGGKISDIQFSAAKDQAITGYRLSKQAIAEKSSSEALDELLGLGYDDDRRFAAGISKVTKEELIRVANEYLQDPVVIVMSPDAKK